ncbi:hypothetical protein WZ78_04120 [Leuconostoc mesenteroides subsp. dextranicum]|jgi:hypothetical protein|uniref:hypothetical protein n=1 Tax=Leuconostoc TaxID=1243 RepID=UPI0006810F4E|nr:MULTISPECIES: hypothetical protein [Leuconostoc]KAA8370104.1 hypothetical protein FE417_00735 [Leuconostoc mesenteroides]KMY81786.1 hypothetical protein WZ78_04120 [Leuconostoc mesenteroides subsp. dextranicum]MBZ1506616.1 hypothetical protein [Leuconostoc mesenteroides]MBZ1509533.1 hypothetical protein [Leuconostoc mesenteroides]MBZ1513312.1 hypothetical protein [Leuconostoc mesenteroides]
MFEDVRLQGQILMEMATFLGDSYIRPVSIALVIQDLGGTEETFSNVLTKTHQLVHNNDISKYTLADFKAFYQKIEPEIFKNVNDVIIIKVLNGLAIMYIDDLYPIAKYLTQTYQLENKLPGI